MSGNVQVIKKQEEKNQTIGRKSQNIHTLKLLDRLFKIIYKKFIVRWRISWIYLKESNARTENLQQNIKKVKYKWREVSGKYLGKRSVKK